MLNPPTQIDRRGLTPKVNFDGTYATEYPNGDKPEPSVDITDLAVTSKTAASVTLGWTGIDEVLALERAVTPGSFTEIQGGIAVNSTEVTDSGLSDGTEYHYRLTFASGTSNTVTVTTNAASASTMPLSIVSVTGEETDRSAFKWSHSEFDYNRRVAARGGKPPYNFYLESAVSGVTVTKKSPTWNPFLFCFADIVIDHTQFASGQKTYTLCCEDRDGTVVKETVPVTVDDSKFVILHKGVGSPAGAGTVASPLNDFEDIYTTSQADNTHAGKIAVPRGAASQYIIDNFDPAVNSFRLDENKVSSIIGYPGERPQIEMRNSILPQFQSGVGSDYYFGNLELHGNDAYPDGSRMFPLFGSQDRITFDRLDFVNPASITGSTNIATIFGSDSQSGRSNVSVIDCHWDGLPSTGDDYSMMTFYSSYDLAIAGCSLRNSGAEGNLGVYLKGANTNAFVIGVDLYDSVNPIKMRLFTFQQGDAGILDPIGIAQAVGCKAYSLTDGNGPTALSYGDSNQAWGSVHCDRMTLIGTIGFGGGDSTSLGSAYLSRSLVFNDNAETINSSIIEDDNFGGARSDISTYLDSNGDILSGSAQLGVRGANFAESEAS